MGLVKTGVSAIGKLLVIVILAAAFMVGMAGVVWLSLRGEEVKVPELVGKDYLQGEQELSSLGLKIKRRAYRYSQEKPNTIIEQSPRAGETAKTGVPILVVVAQANPEGTEAPAPAKKAEEEESADSSETSTEKTKKANTKTKKPEKTRDVISNKSNKNANTAEANSNSSNGSKNGTTNNSENKNGTTLPTTKPTPKSNKTPSTPNDKPAATSGDTRNRRAP